MGIHSCTESGGVYFVMIEVIICLPLAVCLEFAGRDVVEVYDRNVQLFSYGEYGRCKVCEFTLYAIGVCGLVCIAWGECEKHRYRSFGTYLHDETTCVSTECINSILTFFYFIIYDNRVISKAQFTIGTVTGACTHLVNGAIIVMAEFKEYIVAPAYCTECAAPQVW